MPITVGVIGHRDAIITEKHKSIIFRLFKQIALKYPYSPICLFSSLAEGADREVAKIFLDFKKFNTDKFNLIVPVPFEIEEYKNDFENEDSKKEFDKLLRISCRSFLIDSGDRLNKSDQYQQVGKFVADSSVLLLALWDKKVNNKIGGTADIVTYKKTGDLIGKPSKKAFDFEESVIIIECDRESSSSKILQGLEEENILDCVLSNEVIKTALGKIEETNFNCNKYSKTINQSSDDYILEKTKPINGSEMYLYRKYIMFDSLSKYFQKFVNVILFGLFSSGFLVLLSLELYKHVFMNNFVFCIFLILVMFSSIIFNLSRKQKYHGKYMNNRVLAEALRVQFFWKVASINKNVSDFILRIHKNEYNWINHVLSSIYGTSYEEKKTSIDILTKIKMEWISKQIKFFERDITRNEKIVSGLKIISNISLVCSLILLFSIPLLIAYYEDTHRLHLIILLIGSFVGLFALIKAYIEIKGFKQKLNQYDLMKVIYERAERIFNEIIGGEETTDKKIDKIQNLFSEIGKEALIENGNWYLIFKDREPKIEAVG